MVFFCFSFLVKVRWTMYNSGVDLQVDCIRISETPRIVWIQAVPKFQIKKGEKTDKCWFQFKGFCFISNDVVLTALLAVL